MANVVKTWNGTVRASIKTWDGIASASVKTINGLDAAAGSNFVADIWQTYELSAFTTAQLEANDNNASATWSIDNASGYLTTSTSAEKATVSTVNSTADTGTLGLSRIYTTAVAAFLTLNFGADKNSASIGWWFKFTVNPGNNQVLMQAHNNFGSDAMTPVFLRSATRYIGWGAAGNSNGTALTANSWYWITIQRNRNATTYLRVYDDAGAQVGAEATVTDPDVALRKLFIPNYNAEIADATAVNYWDDLVVDYTDSTFPLGP